jgi:hypothetical protein
VNFNDVLGQIEPNGRDNRLIGDRLSRRPAPFKRVLSRQPFWRPLFIEPDAVRRRPHHHCRSPTVGAAIWSISAGQESVPARRHVSALAARRIQARSRNDGRSSNMAPTGERQSRDLLKPSPWHSSLRSGTASAATWRQGCDDRRAGDHQNGTFPTSICLRRKETIAIVRLTRLWD